MVECLSSHKKCVNRNLLQLSGHALWHFWTWSRDHRNLDRVGTSPQASFVQWTKWINCLAWNLWHWQQALVANHGESLELTVSNRGVERWRNLEIVVGRWKVESDTLLSFVLGCWNIQVEVFSQIETRMCGKVHVGDKRVGGICYNVRVVVLRMRAGKRTLSLHSVDPVPRDWRSCWLWRSWWWC